MRERRTEKCRPVMKKMPKAIIKKSVKLGRINAIERSKWRKKYKLRYPNKK